MSSTLRAQTILVTACVAILAASTWARAEGGRGPAANKPKASAPAPPVVAGPQPLDPRAFELNQEALALYQGGEYRKAVAKLEEARRLDPNAKELFYNLATVHEKLAEVEPAVRYYRRYLEVETVAKGRERAEAALRRLEGARKDLEKAAVPPPAQQPKDEAPREPARVSPLVYVGVALTGASLLLGTSFGIAAFLGQPSGKLSTGGGVTYQELLGRAESAHAQAVAADVFFAVGLAAGIATVVVHIVTRPPAQPGRSAVFSLRPSTAPGLGLAMAF